MKKHVISAVLAISLAATAAHASTDSRGGGTFSFSNYTTAQSSAQMFSSFRGGVYVVAGDFDGD
ncbi:MAG: hypothetical protein HKN78_11435 [Sphingomonadaceae bacterium]|nr:hypothetical protein [Sphingomonadaceae bacterium]